MPQADHASSTKYGTAFPPFGSEEIRSAFNMPYRYPLVSSSGDWMRSTRFATFGYTEKVSGDGFSFCHLSETFAQPSKD